MSEYAFKDVVAHEHSPVPATVEMPALPDPLPVMLAWWVLLQPYTPPQQSKGGILLTGNTQLAVKHNQYIAKIAAMGPMAFKSERIVPKDMTGVIVPTVGDWVLINRHQGQLYEKEIPNTEGEFVQLRICADDAIMTILPDPTGWRVGGV